MIYSLAFSIAFSGSLVQDATKLNVTLATDVEGWDKSFSDQFLLELARNSQVESLRLYLCTPQSRKTVPGN